MSKYTTEVRYICENASGVNKSVGYSSINEIISGAIPKVFDFDFPIFDESYRNILCGKILKHYYTREICEETVGLWKLRLSTRMNEIMPYYNKLYESEILTFNPLYDTDYTRTGNKTHDGADNLTANREYTENKNRTTNGTNTNTSITNMNTTNNGNTTEKDKYAETPQGGLTDLENDNYLTNARIKTADENNEANAKSEGNSDTEYSETINDKNSTTDKQNDLREIKTTEDYIEHVTGKTGTISMSKMLMEFRETFINIDMMIINSIADLFFNLW